MKYVFIAVFLCTATVQAEETKKSAGWLKTIGKAAIESPSSDSERPARVAGSRGLGDDRSASEILTDAAGSSTAQEESAPLEPSETPKKKFFSQALDLFN